MNHVAPGSGGDPRVRFLIQTSQVLLLALTLGTAQVPPARGHDPSKHGPNTPPTKPSGPAVTVELQAKIQGDLPWRFWPDRGVIRARRGESVQALYRARSLGKRPTVGKAIHSIMPDGAGEHLSLIECFCFIQATLEPGEERAFPIAFQLRPTLPRTVRRITLRYEFSAEPSGGPVAGTAAPPTAGTLEVWAKATRAKGWRGNPLPVRVMAVGIEGQVSPGLAAWFQVPTVADGIALDANGGRTPLLRGAVPVGSYRALRLQAVLPRGPAKGGAGGVLFQSEPVVAPFTVESEAMTVLMLDLAVRETAENATEVHITGVKVSTGDSPRASPQAVAGER